jgi:integrase
MKLTKTSIGTVAVPHGKSEIIVFDDSLPGFGLRVRIGGSATFIFQFRLGNKQRRMNLGVANQQMLNQARKIAEQLYHQTKLGKDPVAEKAEARVKAAETFGPVLQLFLADKKNALKPRTYEQVERHLLVHSKELHGSQIDAIDRRSVASLLTKLSGSSGPSLSNSVRASLSSAFSWAMGKGLADTNPIIGTEPAVTKGARDRVLSDNELHRIWGALGDNPYGDIVRLLMLTGQRRDEIGSLC